MQGGKATAPPPSAVPAFNSFVRPPGTTMFPPSSTGITSNFSYNNVNRDQPSSDYDTSSTGTLANSASSSPFHSSVYSNTTTPSNPGLNQSTSFAQSIQSFHRPSGLGAPIPESSSGVQRPLLQQHMYPSGPLLPTMAAPPQGIWLQPPLMGSLPRPPFLPHHAVYPGSFPVPGRAVSTNTLLSDSQPPGVTSMSSVGLTQSFSVGGCHPLVGTHGPLAQPLQGIGNTHLAQEAGNKIDSAVGKQADAWTAHKTEAGIIYYYNSLTGQSTYEKPVGFLAEPDKVPAQPTPVSMEHLSGTDWALVTTNDGKKYYYNSKTKISSWQVPSEVTDLRKKQDGETLREHSISAPDTDTVSEHASTPTSLIAPAISNGGRDAATLRPSGLQGSPSALYLIKKKLQDYGVPAAPVAASILSETAASEANSSKAVELSVKGAQSESSKDKQKNSTGDGNMSDSSSDSEDEDSGPTKEECIIQFKDMLRERGVAPFSKWEKELPKIVFDPRFKAIPSHSARRSLFEHYVKTRAMEERKEKRAAQKAAVEGFKQLLDESSEDIDHNTDYQSFKRKWGGDPRFEMLERKDREILLKERVLAFKRVAEEKSQALRAAASSCFKSMLHETKDININSRWSRVKDSLRNDPRYNSVKHEAREVLFNEYISELKAAHEEADREAKAKLDEQEKLKERERELRKRKEREEQEMERVRQKIRRKESVACYQALLMETIKDPQASWTESKPKLDKDPQRRTSNADLDPSDMEKLFREHVKMLHERCAHDYNVLLAEVITATAASQETDDGKSVLNSWSTAKRILKPDPRYKKLGRKEREALWRRYAEDMIRRQKSGHGDQSEEKLTDIKTRR